MYKEMKSILKEYLNRLLTTGNRTAFECFLLDAADSIFPVRIQKQRNQLLGESGARHRIAIFSPSDTEYNLFRRLQWGDYWAQYEMTKALGELGYLVTNVDPDVVIHLLGRPSNLPSRAFKIAWIYSHPEWVTPEILSSYDRIFCLSSKFTQKIRDMGFEAEWAPGASSRSPRLPSTATTG
jgi:hypothetical protein